MDNLGIFIVSKPISKNPKIMALIFERFEPIKFDIDLMKMKYFILCESVEFDEVKEGEKIPEYELIIKETSGGKFYISELTKVC